MAGPGDGVVPDMERVKLHFFLNQRKCQGLVFGDNSGVIFLISP